MSEQGSGSIEYNTPEERAARGIAPDPVTGQGCVRNPFERREIPRYSVRQSVQELVTWFHRIFLCPVGTASFEARGWSRYEFTRSELGELFEALEAGGARYPIPDLTPEKARESHIAALDALADIVYTCYGFAVEMGWDLDGAVEEVHRSNMTKLGLDGKPIKDPATGKVQKGPHYVKPDLGRFIR